jgi:branched-chain amino acid transport system ATP-binding protein
MALLRVEGIDVSYGQVQILWQVSLSIEKGQIVSLLGGNGAGKTTTVKTISGLLSASRGRIEFNGRDITALPAHKRVEAGLIQVPEGRKIFPSLSVLENLEMGSFLKGPKAGRARSLKRIMDLFPILGERSRQPAGTLSGGEQQMLALGRGLMSLPRLLILDEPSLGLAPLVVEEIFRAIQEVNREGVTILLVEQNVPQALAISHQALVLEEGRVALSGRGRELMNDDHIRRLYLGVAD